MTDRHDKSVRGGAVETNRPDPFAGWEAQERAVLESALKATPAQKLERLEEVLEIARAAGTLPRHEPQVRELRRPAVMRPC